METQTITPSSVDTQPPIVPSRRPDLHAFAVWHSWYWGLIPVLAILAYATVLRIGFLSDDFLLLIQARLQGLDPGTLLPASNWTFYRPVGMLLTWQLGWALWGANPLPYHVISLLLHAGTALMLALWLSEATGRRALGWLAGALFAVFPLHLEAVGWVAAQWDVWAAFFGLASLWLFTLWWRRPETNRRLYLLALLAYGLGVFSKESLFTFLPLFAGSAWVAGPRFDRPALRRIVVALLPFAGVLALNLSLRLLAWGNVGGYNAVPTFTQTLVWDQLIAHIQALLAPINTTIFGSTTRQLVGAFTGVALFCGIVWFGYRARRLLLLAAAWVVLILLPVLNLGLGVEDLQQNRFFYLAAAGYCTACAALLYYAVSAATRWRPVAVALVALLLLASTAVCWLQLQPWHVATVQVQELDQELSRLIPPHARPQGMVWTIQNLPDNYKGAYLLRLGLGGQRFLNTGDTPWIDTIDDIARAPLIGDSRDSFALRFKYDEAATRYHVDTAAGVTDEEPLPSSTDSGRHLQVWDFRNCDSAVVDAWKLQNTQANCEPGKGLLLRPTSPDPQLLGPPLSLDPAASGARFVRLRVLARYPAAPVKSAALTEWFWRGPDPGWLAGQRRTLPLERDGQPHTYWTFIPSQELGTTLAQLRLDPINANTAGQIEWIALDLVS